LANSLTKEVFKGGEHGEAGMATEARPRRPLLASRADLCRERLGDLLGADPELIEFLYDGARFRVRDSVALHPPVAPHQAHRHQVGVHKALSLPRSQQHATSAGVLQIHARSIDMQLAAVPQTQRSHARSTPTQSTLPQSQRLPQRPCPRPRSLDLGALGCQLLVAADTRAGGTQRHSRAPVHGAHERAAKASTALTLDRAQQRCKSHATPWHRPLRVWQVRQ